MKSLSETKFKQIVSLLRKDLYHSFPRLKNPLSHKKRRIKIESDSMNVNITDDITLTYSKSGLFFIGFNFLFTYSRDDIASKIREILKENKQDGLICYINEKKRLLGIQDVSHSLISLLYSYNCFDFRIDKGYFVFKNKSPDYKLRYNLENQTLELFTERHYSGPFAFSSLNNEQSIREFIVENERINRRIEQLEDDINHYLKSTLKVPLDNHGLFFQLKDKSESIHISRWMSSRGKGEYYATIVCGTHYRDTHLEKLASLMKQEYKHIFIETRLRNVTGSYQKRA